MLTAVAGTAFDRVQALDAALDGAEGLLRVAAGQVHARILESLLKARGQAMQDLTDALTKFDQAIAGRRVTVL